jgi:hypothetical protein
MRLGMSKIALRIIIISAIFLVFALLIALPQTYQFARDGFFPYYLYKALVCLAIKTSTITITLLNAIFIFDVSKNKFVYSLVVLLMIIAYFFDVYLIGADVAVRV